MSINFFHDTKDFQYTIQHTKKVIYHCRFNNQKNSIKLSLSGIRSMQEKLRKDIIVFKKDTKGYCIDHYDQTRYEKID